MSYKNIILNDYPNAFYLLDEVRSGQVGSYDSLASQFATYADLRDSGLTYSAISGLPVYDYSGNLNDSFALNASSINSMPLISGGVRGTIISNDAVVNFNPKGMATLYYPDNSFSIEAWLVPPISNVETPVVADIENQIGIFHNGNNIIFKVGEFYVEHTLSIKESVHIVGLFSPTSISLYANGILVDKKSIDKYKFLNESINFQSGPCLDSMVIDSVAFYKFNLTPLQISNHYQEGVKELNISQIVNIDGGYLFSMNTQSMLPRFKYSYPESKKWSSFADSSISIAEDGSYLYFVKTNNAQQAEFSFSDTIIVPDYLGITTSQIYWETDLSLIKVEASLDGENWTQCINGNPLPFFNKNDNQISDVLYIKVTISSPDTSRVIPVLKSLEILFYNEKIFYSDNSPYYITSIYDYSLPKINSKNLSYNNKNGLQMYNGHGFHIQNQPSVKSVEMIFTPGLNSNILVSDGLAEYGWDQSGTILSAGIESVYINGVDSTNFENIWDVMYPGLQHHVVISFDVNALSLKFNESQDGLNYGLGHMYNNLAIYEDGLSEYNTLKHYLLYTDRVTESISDTTLEIAEGTSGNNLTAFTINLVQPEAVSI